MIKHPPFYQHEPLFYSASISLSTFLNHSLNIHALDVGDMDTKKEVTSNTYLDHSNIKICVVVYLFSATATTKRHENHIVMIKKKHFSEGVCWVDTKVE